TADQYWAAESLDHRGILFAHPNVKHRPHDIDGGDEQEEYDKHRGISPNGPASYPRRAWLGQRGGARLGRRALIRGGHRCLLRTRASQQRCPTNTSQTRASVLRSPERSVSFRCSLHAFDAICRRSPMNPVRPWPLPTFNNFRPSPGESFAMGSRAFRFGMGVRTTARMVVRFSWILATVSMVACGGGY